jgi:hypothetical protein
MLCVSDEAKDSKVRPGDADNKLREAIATMYAFTCRPQCDT